MAEYAQGGCCFPIPWWADSAEEDDREPDVCAHGIGFDQICVECCPEDDDGSFTGDEWSPA